MTRAILIVLLTAWATAVTLLLIVLVRQVTLISVRLNLQMTIGDFSDFGIGPQLGTTVTERVRSAVDGDGIVVALTGTCGSCHDLVASLPIESPEGLDLCILLSGKGRPVLELGGKIPAWVRVIRDPDAIRLGKELNLARTRRAIRIDDSIVIGSADLSSYSDLRQLATISSKPALTVYLAVVAASITASAVSILAHAECVSVPVRWSRDFCFSWCRTAASSLRT